MSTSQQTRLFWLQASGLGFAAFVALWCLQGTSGREMLRTFAGFATHSHQRTLASQVALLIHAPRPVNHGNLATNETEVRESGPALEPLEPMALVAIVSAFQALPKLFPASGDFPSIDEAARRDWLDRPPLPPPKTLV